MKDKAWNGHFCLPQIGFLEDRGVGWFRKVSDVQFHPYVQGHLKFTLEGNCCQVWWGLPLIITLRNLRQEDCYEFKTSLNCQMDLVASMHFVTSREEEAGPAASEQKLGFSLTPSQVGVWFQFCHRGRKKTFGDSPKVIRGNLMIISLVFCETLEWGLFFSVRKYYKSD